MIGHDIAPALGTFDIKLFSDPYGVFASRIF